MELSERRQILAHMYYIRRSIDETLEEVMTSLYSVWATLPEADRIILDQKRRALAEEIRLAPTSFERGLKIDLFLKEMEAIDSVLEHVFEIMLKGKTSERFRNAGGPAQAAGNRLAALLEADLEGAQSSAVIEKGIEMALPGDLLAAADPVEPGAESTTVQFYTKVDFPARIAGNSSDVHLLVVQLVLNRPAATQVDGTVDIAFRQPKEPEFVEVFVHAGGFREQTGIWVRTIAVYSYQDSQPAIFLLTLADPEPKIQRITVDFYHRGRNVGSFVFQTQITGSLLSRFSPVQESISPAERAHTPEGTLGTATVARALGGIQLPVGPPPPVDVELRITRQDRRTLHFTLHSARANIGYHWQAMGSVQLDGLDDPMTFFQHQFDRLNQLAEQPVTGLATDTIQEYETELAALGYELYTQLFPEKLRQEYWKLLDLRDRIRKEEQRTMSLLITSDEPWVPWEMVKPYEDEERNSDFLAGAFQLSRWLAGRGPMDRLNIEAVQLIAPSLDLDFVQDEQRYFASLAARGVRVGETIVTYREVLDIARRGGVQLLHVATHGNFNIDQVNESPIRLQDRDLLPRDLNKMVAGGLLRDHPIVFFNTCHGGRLGFDLTKPGGWAQRMVDEFGVTAFIGSHWAINDQLAAKFSQVFYNHLLAGKTLGDAFHMARQTIRQEQPANPTWLAYTLYGDPNSYVSWPQPTPQG